MTGDRLLIALSRTNGVVFVKHENRSIGAPVPPRQAIDTIQKSTAALIWYGEGTKRRVTAIKAFERNLQPDLPWVKCHRTTTAGFCWPRDQRTNPA